MRIASTGHVIFAATMILVGVLGLISGDFTVIWQPVPRDVPARELLIYGCALIPLACGLGLFWTRTAAAAARVLLAYLLLWLLVFRLPGLLHSLAVDVYWALSRTAAIAAAAWVLYSWFAADADKRWLVFATGHSGVRIAQVLYGLAIIPFGIAHFQYAAQTAAQVPRWLPAHMAWVYFTGGAFIAAGLAMIVGVYGRLAATLSAVEMGAFLLLVWIPVVAAGPTTSFQRGETLVTWILTAAGWMMADSYRSPNRASQ